jgi:hypothetical protein
VTDDIETRVLQQFKLRLDDSPEVDTATQKVLLEDLDSMESERSELLDTLLKERKS